jgi:exodeoxyribonuclease VIII
MEGGGMSDLIHNLSFEDYQKIDAVNFSTLKNMAISPMHYRYWAGIKKEDTPSTLLGRGVHTSVLEPDRFPLEYTVYRESKTKGKGAKTNWQAFQAANQDKTILSLDDYQQCLAIRDAVRKHPKAGPLLDKGQAEVSLVWDDPETGILCKGRLDWLRPTVVVDLKTSRHIVNRRFWRDAVDYQYHTQLAFYVDGLMACRSQSYLEFKDFVYMICAQATPPWDVVVYAIPDYILDIGRERYHEWLRDIKRCRELGEWPGVADDYADPEFPDWAIPGEKLQLTQGGKSCTIS